MVDKLILFSSVVFIIILVLFINNKSMASKTYTLLVLGDSYSIGEGVALYETFSYQAVQMLRKAGHNFNAPEIIARTGWTTQDLNQGIKNNRFQSSYNYVSVLIGVNDQYQGKPIDDYSRNFEMILKHAISFAGNNDSNVFVFSIPDWGRTPFASGRNREEVTREINEFNNINKNLSLSYRVQYITIPEEEVITDLRLLAADQLHPSGREYAKWASLLFDEIQKRLA